MIRRGDIRWFRFAAPDKRRPVLIMGPDSVLDTWHQLPAVPLSTQRRGLSWEVHLGPDDGLPTACALKPEWVRSVERAEIGPLIAQLRPERWPEVRQALLDAMGFSSD